MLRHCGNILQCNVKMQILTDIAQIDRKQWDELVASSATATFFQTAECYDFYASLACLDAFVVAVAENDKLRGVICGYVVADGGALKRYFSRRAIIPGGALLADDISEKALGELLLACKNLLKSRAIYVELRNYNDYSRHKTIFEKYGFCYKPHYDIHVDTLDKTLLYQRISESKRRKIKASQTNLEIVENPNETEFSQFYDLLSELYQKRIKRPLFPKVFFEELEKKEWGNVLVVKSGNEVVGGMAMVVWRDVAYEWFVCGNDNSECHASVMATWAGLDFANKNGCRKFDFMGAGEPDKPYGVRDFKMRFGGELHEFGRFLLVQNRLLFAIGKMGVRLAKII